MYALWRGGRPKDGSYQHLQTLDTMKGTYVQRESNQGSGAHPWPRPLTRCKVN
jgi:hypothetical protein